MRLSKAADRNCCVALIAAAILAATAVLAQNPSADSLVINARIYTVNSQQPWAEALAIRSGKILAVGAARELEKYRGTATKVLDAKGYLVLPGFTDSHIHFLDGSLSLLRVNLAEAKTVSQIQKLVKEYADKNPHEPWVLGRGWQYPVFAPSGLPDKKYLDEIIPDRPVYLEAFDGHSWWGNSKALQLAGVTAKTADPPNGKIVRDPATGEPSGAIQ